MRITFTLKETQWFYLVQLLPAQQVPLSAGCSVSLSGTSPVLLSALCWEAPCEPCVMDSAVAPRLLVVAGSWAPAGVETPAARPCFQGAQERALGEGSRKAVVWAELGCGPRALQELEAPEQPQWWSHTTSMPCPGPRATPGPTVSWGGSEQIEVLVTHSLPGGHISLCFCLLGFSLETSPCLTSFPPGWWRLAPMVP